MATNLQVDTDRRGLLVETWERIRNRPAVQGACLQIVSEASDSIMHRVEGLSNGFSTH